jgi:hypothetical protein
MPRTVSEFHYARVFSDARALSSKQQLHDELAFKLGLPSWYGRNWDALLDCLSSIGEPSSDLCSHWEFRTGKPMVLRIQGFSAKNTDHDLLAALAQTVADANSRLNASAQGISIWLEFIAAAKA